MEVLNEVKTVRFLKCLCRELFFLAVAALLIAGPAAADGVKSRQLALLNPSRDFVPTLSARNDSLTSDLQSYVSGHQEFIPSTRSYGVDQASLLEPNSLRDSAARPDFNLAFSMDNIDAAKSSRILDGPLSSRTAAGSTPPAHRSTLSALLPFPRHHVDKSGPAPELGSEPSDFVLLGICLLLAAGLLGRRLPVPKASTPIPSSSH